MPDIVLRVASLHRNANILPYEDNASGRDPEAEFDKGRKMLDESSKVADKIKKLQDKYKGKAKDGLKDLTSEAEELLQELEGDDRVQPYLRMVRPLIPKLKSVTPEQALGSGEVAAEFFHWVGKLQEGIVRLLRKSKDDEVLKAAYNSMNSRLSKPSKQLTMAQKEYDRDYNKLSAEFIDKFQFAEILPPLDGSPDHVLIEDYNSMHGECMSRARHIILHQDTLEEEFTFVMNAIKEMEGYLDTMEKNYKKRVYK